MKQNLASIESMLACPSCRGAVRCTDDAVVCQARQSRFAIQDGIPLFARIGTPSDAPKPEPGESSESYQRRYQQDKKAEKYNAMYRDSWAKYRPTRQGVDVYRRIH